jgi:hypothetical protein
MERTLSTGWPTLLLVDDHAAALAGALAAPASVGRALELTNLWIVGMRARGVIATDADTMIDYQHRSPSR